MRSLEEPVDRVATGTGFSGVVRVDGGGVELARAFGLADRRHGIANTLDTQFGIASGTKGRSLLGDDLPLIDHRVTVEQLLAHRSGIGDYFDEEAALDVLDHVLHVQ